MCACHICVEFGQCCDWIFSPLTPWYNRRGRVHKIRSNSFTASRITTWHVVQKPHVRLICVCYVFFVTSASARIVRRVLFEMRLRTNMAVFLRGLFCRPTSPLQCQISRKSCSGPRLVACGQRDGLREANRRIVAAFQLLNQASVILLGTEVIVGLKDTAILVRVKCCGRGSHSTVAVLTCDVTVTSVPGLPSRLRCGSPLVSIDIAGELGLLCAR